ERLIVARDNQSRSRPARDFDHLMRSYLHRRRNSFWIAQCLRGHPVLTVAAMIITAEHTERQRKRSGIRMKERFLLGRIALNSANISAWHHQAAVFVVTHAANAIQPRENHTTVAARITADAVA